MLSRVLALGVLLAGEAAAVAGLHALGGLPWFALPSGDVGAWLATSAPADVIVALLRLAALGCAYWLALSTAAYALARVSRVPAAVRGTGRVTLPAVRRVADRALAVTMATSLAGVSAPAALAAVGDATPPTSAQVVAEEPVTEPGGGAEAVGIPPPSLTPESLPEPGAGSGPDGEAPERDGDVADEHDGDGSSESEGGVAGGGEGDGSTESESGAADEGDDGPPDDPGEVHVVRPGDHLWGIAAADLAAGSERAASQLEPSEVAPHWREVVADNHERLRSGDPDLIYPGEHVELPSDEP